MTTTPLSLANGALRLIGNNRPLTQAEYNNGTRESARAVKAAIDDGAIRYCLEKGMWKFATRSVMLDSTASLEDEIGGYSYVFIKPTDFVKTCGLFSDGTMRREVALPDYRDEAGHWFANVDPIYVAFVSDDTLYGLDYSLWPQSFVKYVQAHLASEVAGPLTERGMEMIKLRKLYLDEALGSDAMEGPEQKLPAGAWVNARRSGRLSREQG